MLTNIDCELFLHEVSEKPKFYQQIDWDKIKVNLNRIRKQSLDYLSESL